MNKNGIAYLHESPDGKRRGLSFNWGLPPFQRDWKTTALVPATVSPLLAGIEWKAQGEANFYSLLRGKQWVAIVQINGEMLVWQQEALLNAMLCGTPAPVDAGRDLYVECRQCCSCGHAGINDCDGKKSACHNCDWTGDSPVEDKCPGCGDKNCMAAACPKCGERYSLLAEETIVSAPAGVPEVDWLANVIRAADGNHSLGAGALAEKIVEAMLSASPVAPADAVAKDAEKQRDDLLAALEFAREKIAELHVEAGDGDCHYPIIDDAIASVKAAMQGEVAA